MCISSIKYTQCGAAGRQDNADPHGATQAELLLVLGEEQEPAKNFALL